MMSITSAKNRFRALFIVPLMLPKKYIVVILASFLVCPWCPIHGTLLAAAACATIKGADKLTCKDKDCCEEKENKDDTKQL